VLVSDRQLRLWDAATGAEREVVKREGPSFGGASPLWAVPPGGKTLVYADYDGSLRWWDLAAGKESRRVADVVDWHDAAGQAFAADGLAFAARRPDGVVKLYRTATGEEDRTLHLNPTPQPETRLVPGPGSAALAVAGPKSLTIYDGTTGYKRWAVEDLGVLPDPAFAPDGRTLAYLTQEVVLAETATGLVRLKFDCKAAAPDPVAVSPDGRLLAVGGPGTTVQVFDVVTGKEVAKFAGHRGEVNRLAFSPDGRRLASGGWDLTVLVWDLAAARKGLAAAGDWPASGGTLWDDLASAEGGRAHKAVWTLALHPGDAEKLLKGKVKQGTAVGDKEIARFVKDLDADDFDVRERAVKALAALGDRAVPALEKVLEGNPSVELRKRITDLLDRYRRGEVDPDRARAARALEVLERLGTAEAKALLEEVAKGPAEAWETQDAKRALDRLGRRTNAP
jgi:WD40 repeat protein